MAIFVRLRVSGDGVDFPALLALAELGAELHLEVSCLKEIYEGNYDGKGR